MAARARNTQLGYCDGRQWLAASGGWHGQLIVWHGCFGRAEAGTRRPFRGCRKPCFNKTPPPTETTILPITSPKRQRGKRPRCLLNPNGVPSSSKGFGERQRCRTLGRRSNKTISNPEGVAPAGDPNRTPTGLTETDVLRFASQGSSAALRNPGLEDVTPAA